MLYIKPDFKAIYNPYTRNLLVRYGDALIERFFEETEEWTIVNFNNEENNPYYLHIQLDYDENFQLLFYPRYANTSDLNENYGTYYNSENNENPSEIKLIHTDREWDNSVKTFLEASKLELELFKKINY